MARGWNAAGGWLQAANAGKMRWSADGTTPITAHTAHGTATCDSGRFATAGTTRGVGKIPWIRRFSRDAIVRFIGHQKFGCIGVAEQNRAGIFKASTRAWRSRRVRTLFAKVIPLGMASQQRRCRI